VLTDIFWCRFAAGEAKSNSSNHKQPPRGIQTSPSGKLPSHLISQVVMKYLRAFRHLLENLHVSLLRCLATINRAKKRPVNFYNGVFISYSLMWSSPSQDDAYTICKLETATCKKSKIVFNPPRFFMR